MILEALVMPHEKVWAVTQLKKQTSANRYAVACASLLSSSAVALSRHAASAALAGCQRVDCAGSS